jgi:uncharacterized protein YggU (UPF0235/DUF167 family)
VTRHLEIRVVPNARQSGLAERKDGVLVLKIAAPARDGAANKAARRYLAELFGVSKTSVRLLAGEKSRLKKFEIIGLDAGHLERTLAGLLAER